MQFADDTAIVTSLESDNQHLINAFSKWASWAGLLVRVDKCKSFAMKKVNTSTVQYEPYLTVNNERIPPVELNDQMTYLGKDFNFLMSCDHIKNQLTTEIDQYLQKTNLLPLHPLQKIQICQQFILSKMKWRFSIYDLTETWIIQNIENKFNRFYRKWLQIPVNGNVTHLFLPNTKLGLNMKEVKSVYRACKLTVRRILKCSNNKETEKLYQITSSKNVITDEIINKTIIENDDSENYEIRSKCSYRFNKSAVDDIWETFLGLKEQSTVIKKIVESCYNKDIILWQSIMRRLPVSIFNFSRRYLILTLANNSNLFRWKICETNLCALCEQVQTQLHVFNFCKAALNRYTWRHNSILSSLCNHILKNMPPRTTIYADIDGFQNPNILFRNKRPDFVLKTESRLYIIELTCPYETNAITSREYKQNKYKHLKQDLLAPMEIEIIFLEITSLGFITKNCKTFRKLMSSFNYNVEYILSKLCEVGIRCSYFIYCKRNKEWENPPLITYL